jgi:Tol biopolymer transport system component
MKKKTLWLGTMGILLTAVFLGALSQSGEDLFQKALRLERNEGKLLEAIDLYGQVVSEKGNENLAAQAQLRIGLCYEKLGQKSLEQAQEAFQKVIDNFPGQSETVKEARERLAALMAAQAGTQEEDKGITIRKLWAADGASDYGSPSPDGRYFAFHHYQTGDLAIRNIATGDVRRLFMKSGYQESKNTMVGYSCWSPDRKQIAYEWQSDPYEIRIVNVDGSHSRTVYKSPDWISPYNWSPDGKSILTFLQREDREDCQFGILNIENGSLQEFDTRVGISTTAGFSPDSRFVALTVLKDSSNNTDVSLYSLAEKKWIPVVEHPADDHVVGWSPDGKWVLFGSDRSGTFDLWAVRFQKGQTSQGEPTLIKKGVGENLSNAWLTRIGAFYYSIGVSYRDVFTAKIDFETNRVLEAPKRATERYINTHYSPEWSPDGQHLAFFSREAEDSPHALCILSIGTGEVQKIFPQLDGFRNPPIMRWSSDGRGIIHTGWYKPDGIGVFRTELSTENMSAILRDGPGQIRGFCVSEDGKILFYNKLNLETNMSQLIALDLDAQTTEVLYECNFLQGLALSPEGKMLAFSEEVGGSGRYDLICELKILSVQGGELRTLFRTKEGGWIETLDWTPDGQILLFTQMKAGNGRENPVTSLTTVPVSGGAPQELGITGSIRHLRIHPDGQSIAFTAGQRGKEVWAMENIMPKDKEDGRK